MYDASACNYNADATDDDGSCDFADAGYDCDDVFRYTTSLKSQDVCVPVTTMRMLLTTTVHVTSPTTIATVFA